MSDVPTFVECHSVEVRDGQVTAVLRAEAGEQVNVALTPDCLLTLFGHAWKAMASLPLVKAGRSMNLPSNVQIAPIDASPTIIMRSGPCMMHLSLEPGHAKAMSDEIARLLAAGEGSQH